MNQPLRIAYIAHSLRSDWNNGNAHFLRGLLRALVSMGHDVIAFEPCTEWSIENLREETLGERSLQQFAELYPDLTISTFRADDAQSALWWKTALRARDVVIFHEWNSPALAQMLLGLREECQFRLLFHDTHHRASSSPEQIRLFGTDRFDGVLCFGDSLRHIYESRFGIRRVWTLHEAADTTIFRPHAHAEKAEDVIWIGNWGDGERTREITEFLLEPARTLHNRSFCIYGVRYPEEGLNALEQAGVRYGGYLPNLQAPQAYAAARLTIHIPRQQYSRAMDGIPTIRVFEALACGIPLISAPWRDSEHLFNEGDFVFVRNAMEMRRAMLLLLDNPAEAEAQTLRGLTTILSRHTCRHRAEELTEICEEILQ